VILRSFKEGSLAGACNAQAPVSATTPSNGWRRSHSRGNILDLIIHLVGRDFRLRYAGSLLGMLWALALPVSQLVVLVFVFQRLIPLNIDAYPVFVLAALLPWNWFSSAMTGAGQLFLNQRDFLRYPHFPAVILPVVHTLSFFLLFLMASPLVVLLLIWYGRQPTSAMLALPLLILIQAGLTIALSWCVAVANTLYRDIQYLVSVVLSLLFYLTPIFYGPHPAFFEHPIVLFVHPMAPLTQNYRIVLLDGQWPPLMWLVLPMLSTLVLFAIALSLWRALEPKVYDAL
jgi:lipopolysaccharide transport system permease protein